jgi:hypothetical protein
MHAGFSEAITIRTLSNTFDPNKIAAEAKAYKYGK